MRHLSGYSVLAVVANVLWSFSALAAPVTDDNVLWLDASDVATIADGEGDNPGDAGFDNTVQTWTDKSGTANHATAPTAARPVYVPSAANGSGAVGFNNGGGTQSLNTANTNTLNGESMFFVTKLYGLDAGTDRGGWVGNQTDPSGFANRGNPERYFLGVEDGDSGQVVNDSPQTYQVVGESRRAINADVARVNISEDSAVVGGFSRGRDVNINTVGRSNGEFLRGEVTEVLVYNRTLNTAERVITDNYLSSKYMTAPLAANDKYAGDTAGNGNHDFEVFGIGRDAVTPWANDAEEFVNPEGALNGIDYVATGGGIALAEANTSLADGEYLLAGHDGTAHSLTSSDVPAGIVQRWARDFFLDVTGTLDAELTFDFASAGLGTPDAGGYKLLYRAATSGPFTDLGIVGTVSGNEVQFDLNAVDTSDDGFYTIGAIPEPSAALAVAVGLMALARRRRH